MPKPVEGTSLLETPPFTIALVFLGFLIVTIGFERLLRWLKNALERRRKHGLLQAISHMSTELMLLGVASVILLGCQERIQRICVSSRSYSSTTWLDHVEGRACCLGKTQGVSLCFLRDRGIRDLDDLNSCCYGAGTPQILDDTVCPKNGSSYVTKAPRGLHLGRLLLAPSEAGDSGADPSGAEDPPEGTSCDGPVEVGYAECGYKENMRPAISVAALHQIHLFIFELAVAHILSGIALILFASLRLQVWKRWGRREDDLHLETVHKMVQTAPLKASGEPSLKAVDRPSPGQPPPPDPSRGLEQVSQGERHKALPKRVQVGDTIGNKKPWTKWRGREEVMAWPILSRVAELFWCLLRQFQVQVVTQEEFALVRASFALTHQLSPEDGFSFTQYVVGSMDEDFAKLCGLGPEMWTFLLVLILASSTLGWSIWVFTVLAGALLLVVNTKLVWIARYVTRGGCVHELKPGVFWLNRPWLLLPILRFLLFFVSFVFGNSFFFATQFGRHSCFFSNTGFQRGVFPWWVTVVTNTIFLITLCSLTLPLYSLVCHCGGEVRHSQIPQGLQERLLSLRQHKLEEKEEQRRRAAAALEEEKAAQRREAESCRAAKEKAAKERAAKERAAKDKPQKPRQEITATPV